MRTSLCLTAIITVLLSAPLMAQDERAPGLRADARKLAVSPQPACPNPVKLTIPGPPAAPAVVLAELPASWQSAVAGSVWNQTAADKHFAHTFKFPSPRECCLMSSGVLTVTIKALQTAPPNSSASGNDAVHVASNGAVVASKQPWLTTGVTAGTQTTVTFPIPANVLSRGLVSFYVQDDSAVVAASLTVEGCCINKH